MLNYAIHAQIVMGWTLLSVDLGHSCAGCNGLDFV